MIYSSDISLIKEKYISKESIEEFSMYSFLDYLNKSDVYFNGRLDLTTIAVYKGKSCKSVINNFIKYNEDKSVSNFIKFLRKIDSYFSKPFRKILLKELSIENFKKYKYINDAGYKLPIDDPTYLGREAELEYFEIMLSRKYKNNIIIVGEPSIGKTSFVNKYASLTNDEVWCIELNRLLADTKYRGEFKKMITNVLDEAVENQLVLFIDEVHILLGAGSSEGGISASNILKPYLTKKEIKIIGATTIDEFNLFMADRALERRFNILMLRKLNKEEIFKIVHKVSNDFKFENLSFDDFNYVSNALDRLIPDKIIDFMDFYYTYILHKGLNHDLKKMADILDFFAKNSPGNTYNA